MMEIVVVGLIVALAVAYAVYRLVKFFKNAGKCAGCDGSCAQDLARRMEEDP